MLKLFRRRGEAFFVSQDVRVTVIGEVQGFPVLQAIVAGKVFEHVLREMEPWPLYPDVLLHNLGRHKQDSHVIGVEAPPHVHVERAEIRPQQGNRTSEALNGPD